MQGQTIATIAATYTMVHGPQVLRREVRRSDRARDTWTTIFRVPRHIRQLDSEGCEPNVIGLGLFHHDTHSSFAMEMLKGRCLEQLLRRHGSPDCQNHLSGTRLSELEKQDDRVRSCYSEERRPADKSLSARVMLRDGCFIICLMLEMWQEDDDDGRRDQVEIDVGEDGRDSNMRKRGEKLQLLHHELGQSTFNIAVYDVLKLENQIPFFVIRFLFDLLKPCEDREIDVVDLALQLFKHIHPKQSESFKKQEDPKEYDHLLRLFYLSRIPAIDRKKPEAATGCKMLTPSASPKWTPSAAELDRAGVKFGKKKEADNFMDIKFEQRKMKITRWLCLLKLYLMFKSGRMEIPPLQIYSYTSHLFQNLMAFEQCYPGTETYITTYLFFMDGIINQAEDVRLLRLEGVLEHKLSSDQAVAELFNKLGTHIDFVKEENYLANQMKDVKKFYDSKWHKRIAALRRDCFNSPWATISVLAAIFLLLLTVEHAIFSALSYFHKP